MSLETSLGRTLPAEAYDLWMTASAFTPFPEMIAYIEALKTRGCIELLS